MGRRRNGALGDEVLGDRGALPGINEVDQQPDTVPDEERHLGDALQAGEQVKASQNRDRGDDDRRRSAERPLRRRIAPPRHQHAQGNRDESAQRPGIGPGLLDSIGSGPGGGIGGGGGGGGGDDITPAAPEPATWIMMVLGIGLIAGLLRRARAAERAGTLAVSR